MSLLATTAGALIDTATTHGDTAAVRKAMSDAVSTNQLPAANAATDLMSQSVGAVSPVEKASSRGQTMQLARAGQGRPAYGA